MIREVTFERSYDSHLIAAKLGSAISGEEEPDVPQEVKAERTISVVLHSLEAEAVAEAEANSPSLPHLPASASGSPTQ